MKAKKIVALMLALVMVLALGTSAFAATGDMSNPVTVSGVTLTFGDTENPTWPESSMYFKEVSTNSFSAVYSTDGTTVDTSYYPDILSLYIVGDISSVTGSNMIFVTYDDDGTPTETTTTTVNADGYYTIKPQSNSSTITVNSTVTVSFSAPNTATSTGGSTPAAVNGYLPVGQFARNNSFGWGMLYTDNTNVKSASNKAKFLDGYISTGVSLGMAGGYIQFDMGSNPIKNNPKNPYGIDFIVYGNAFKGNPEAAGVMVSNDGIKWYTLAGSRHYMNGTKWDQKISYVRIEGSEQRALKSTFTADGIYYSENYNSPSEQTQSAINAAISAANWDVVPASGTGSALNLSYWPEWTLRVASETNPGERYGNVWKVGTDSHIPAVASTANNAGVNWDKADKVTETPNGAEVITYSGLTIVPDDTVVLKNQGIESPSQAQMTDVYQWGYADVRVNGTAYGTAINPYASAASEVTGGDGFDLSWAVDENGMPVSLTSVKYVRVYSAVLFNAGIFGETSAEVCGLYVAQADTANVGATGFATVASSAGTMTNSIKRPNVLRAQTITVPTGTNSTTLTLSSSADNFYVNGVSVEGSSIAKTVSRADGTTQYFSVITQTASKEASINVIKVVFQ